MLAQQHACCCCHPDKRSWYAPPSGRGCFRLQWFCRFFRRKNNCMMFNPPGSQFLAHNTRKSISVCFGKIRNLKKLCVLLISGSHGGNNRDISLHTGLNQIQLTGYQINAVSHKRILLLFGWEKLFPAPGIVQLFPDMKPDFRINFLKPLGHYQCFCPACIFPQRL